MRERLASLDGLKGIAILIVVATHIPLVVWYKIIPPPLHLITFPILAGGTIAVSIFFLLTGFLMGLLYPKPSSPLDFYARRYARLFPAFLAMVLSLTFLQIVKLPPFAGIITAVISITIFHFLWKFYLSYKNKGLNVRRIIKWALVIQAVTALSYIFLLTRIPAPIFYIVWGNIPRTLVISIVNATLTLPFGIYIPQLDGVYWALCSEVTFYILYPILISPLIQKVNERVGSFGKLILFISLIPFSYGIYLVSQRVLGLGILQIYFIIYFVVGVFLGINLDSVRKKFIKFVDVFSNPVWLILLLFVVFSSVLIDTYIPKYFQYWLSIFMVIPSALLLISAITPSAERRTILTNSALTKIGKYSFAIFISHFTIIPMVRHYISTDSAMDAVEIIIWVGIITGFISVLLQRYVEQPYFAGRKKSSASSKTLAPFPFLSVPKAFALLSISLFFLLYVAYRPSGALFTYIYRHGPQSFRGIINPETITLSTKPVNMSLSAKQDNLGEILTHIKNVHVNGVENGFVPFKMQISLSDNSQISQSDYAAYQILDDHYLPFGFTPQIDSKGKNYTVSYKVSQLNPEEEIKIVKDEGDFLSVYFANKSTILRNPKILFSWAFHKIAEPFYNISFWFSLIQIIPFLLALLFAIYVMPRKSSNK